LVLYLALSHVLFGFSLASKAYVQVLSLAFFSKAYVKVLGADFLSPLFSHSFPFSDFPAILFPSVIPFPSKSFPHQKA
jgi:hypothetical protein